MDIDLIGSCWKCGTMMEAICYQGEVDYLECPSCWTKTCCSPMTRREWESIKNKRRDSWIYT